MKIRIMTLALVALVSVACAKMVVTTIPENGEEVPEITPANLDEFHLGFPIYSLSYKTDPSTGDIFLETWRSAGRNHSYVPSVQLLGADRKLKWSNWVTLTDLPADSYVNRTVFDITSDGGIIDCYNVLEGEELETEALRVVKLSKDGQIVWDKEFDNFGVKAPYTPCEGFVAADSRGGAWVAGGNGLDSLVIRRVDSDGNFTDPISFGTKGSLDEMQYVCHPQMFVNESDELFVIIQYSTMVDDGGGSYEPTYKGYYDVLKISAEGDILSTQTLLSYMEDSDVFNGGLRAEIKEDGLGGAYVVFKRPKNAKPHVFVYHFNSSGMPDFANGVDILPRGTTTSILGVRSDVDPDSHNLVSVMVTLKMDNAEVYMQTLSTSGDKLVGEDGNPLTIITTEAGTDISMVELKVIGLGEGKMNLSYIEMPYMKAPVLHNAVVTTNGEIVENREVVEIDRTLGGGSAIDNSDCIIDGNLYHLWFSRSGSDGYIYGYSVNVK